jgi:hypothetical protein
MPGYANNVITLTFPELSADPENDSIHVVIRNPRLMSASQLKPRDIALDGDGNPIDEKEAEEASFEVMARIIIGWRVYDPTAEITVDDDGNVTSEPVLLPKVYNAETIGKLPMVIFSRLGTEMTEALNPQ